LHTTHSAKSIYSLAPLETGGTTSRVGIGFQDHVAAGFCLDMLVDSRLREVWVESQDDITLIWEETSQVKVEFVQVKSNELNQLWSSSTICNREGKGPGHSILEKSLANDRCEEPCCFRMVTARPVQDELKILTYSLGSDHRKKGEEALKAMQALLDSLSKKVAGFTSDNKHDYSFWAANALWEEKHSEEAVKNKALLKIRAILEAKGTFLAGDQIAEVYDRLLRKVWDAARVDYRVDATAKRLKKSDMESWFGKIVNEISYPASSGAGTKMQEKMEAATLPEDTIKAAHEERRHYREEVLRPQYLSVTDSRLIEREVLAALQRLKADLDNGKIPDAGPVFHAICLHKLEELQRDLPLAAKPPMFFLQGYMYSVADRCLHRFRRATA
jgi:hypothetical protein